MIKRFIRYYKPHKKLFALDMLASLLVALIALVYPVVTRRMLNDLIPNRKLSLVVAAGVLVLALYLIRAMLNYFIQYQGHMMGVRMQAQMRSELFRHLQKLPFSFFDNNETGQIMSRLTNDLMDISELAHHGPEIVITSSVSVVLAIIYLSTIHAGLAVIIFLCVPLLLVTAILTRTNMRRASLESRKATAKINASIESSITGIRVTKAFTNAKKEEEKFEVGNTEFKQARRGMYKAMGQFQSSTSFITDLFNVVILIAGGVFLYRGSITFADYSAFVVSVSMFLTPISTLIRFMEQFISGATGFERFVHLMDIEEEQDREGATAVDRLSGQIEFQNVSYGYEEGHGVLNRIDLSIAPGETFALVGPSGGGKTTICHLIPRFYDIDGGQLLIDGRRIEDITMESLRRNIGIVQQDVFLFNASIRDNILYGKLDATEEEVIEAAKRANIHEYILSLDEGYDTVIGERGVRLSGGQKQRLCIARVFLKNPPILILDEATSALDNTTEILIQQALDELSRGRTTLVVAHRLSTIKRADKIAVVSEGSIAELGSHDELLSLNGTYADLYRLQFRGQ